MIVYGRGFCFFFNQLKIPKHRCNENQRMASEIVAVDRETICLRLFR